jgi:hypothetical protein
LDHVRSKPAPTIKGFNKHQFLPFEISRIPLVYDDVQREQQQKAPTKKNRRLKKKKTRRAKKASVEPPKYN